MGAAASILAVGFVILIIGAVIYYMTYSGKLSINKNKSSPNNSRPPVDGNCRVPVPRNNNGVRIQPVNGNNGVRIQPVNGNNGVVVRPVNGNSTIVRNDNGPPNGNGIIVQSNRTSPRMNNGTVSTVSNGNTRISPRMNGVSVLPNSNGSNMSPRSSSIMRTNGPEFFVQMPSSEPSSGNGTVSVQRGVRIETLPNGVNIVPVNEVDTNATVYRCEEVRV